MSQDSDENIEPEVGGLRMPSTGDVDPIGEGDDIQMDESQDEIIVPVQKVEDELIDKPKKTLVTRIDPVSQNENQLPPQQIIINQQLPPSNAPQKSPQQIVYTSKKTVSKDKIGLGCLLEALGIFVFFITIFTNMSV